MGGCCECCKRFAGEFKKERMDYDDFNQGRWIKVFGTSSNRCLKNGLVYTSFRLLESLFMTTVCVWSLVDWVNEGRIACWPIYLTHWGLVLQVLYFWFATYTSLQAHLMESGKRPMSNEMPCFARATWILQDLALPGSFLIFVLYWLLVVPSMSGSPTTLSYFTHGVDFVVVILDVFLSRQPYYLLHGIYFALFGVIYLVWSYVYYQAGGTDCAGNRYIYKAIDWSQPDSTAMLGAILVFVAVPIMNFVFWFIISQCFPQNYQKETEVAHPEP